jgi:hypothetical protein
MHKVLQVADDVHADARSSEQYVDALLFFQEADVALRVRLHKTHNDNISFFALKVVHRCAAHGGLTLLVLPI